MTFNLFSTADNVVARQPGRIGRWQLPSFAGHHFAGDSFE